MWKNGARITVDINCTVGLECRSQMSLMAHLVARETLVMLEAYSRQLRH